MILGWRNFIILGIAGVLLINSSLTLGPSVMPRLWNILFRFLMDYIKNHCPGVVFIPTGKEAQERLGFNRNTVHVSELKNLAFVIAINQLVNNF